MTSPAELLRQVTVAYQAGDQKQAFLKASEGYRQTSPDSQLHADFALELARIDILRGRSTDALKLLSEPLPRSLDVELQMKRQALRVRALNVLGRPFEARKVLADAGALGSGQPSVELETVRGELLRQDGDWNAAAVTFRNALRLAEARHDRYRQIGLLMGIGAAETASEHFDQALESFHRAIPLAELFGNRVLHEKLIGDLGFAQLGLGDYAGAEENFRSAAAEAQEIKLDTDVIFWGEDEGYAKSLRGDTQGARQIYETILKQALQLGDAVRIADTHRDLGSLFLRLNDPVSAAPHLTDAAELYMAGRNEQQLLEVHLLQASSEARYADAVRAASQLLAIDQNTIVPPSLRWQAEVELALLAVRQTHDADAHRWFEKAILTFQQQQCSVHDVTARLPFQENGTDLYKRYVEHLIGEGRTDEALMVYDQGRATALRDCEAIAPATRPALSVPSARHLAKTLHGTILVYYLLPEKSYLWAVSPKRTGFYPLPGAGEITRLVDRHQTLMKNSRKDPLQEGDGAGRALYDTLIGPAKAQIAPGGAVYVLADRGLSKLNFETLVTPGDRPHFWIEDATIVNASSLRMLAQGLMQTPLRASRHRSSQMLLIGNPAYPPNIPGLPHAAEEVQKVAGHFAPDHTTVFTGSSATSSAYIKQDLKRYSNVHVVAHAEASENSPLDSYLLLAGGSDKLHAYDIVNYPLRANLVTLSVCDASGKNSVAGEGLVGLAWAFERAGARSVIGTLWEVDDETAPRLMDHMYENLAHGMPPDQALRKAKLSALHSNDVFSKPYYWAQFQLYSNRPELRN